MMEQRRHCCLHFREGGCGRNEQISAFAVVTFQEIVCRCSGRALFQELASSM
jgi:hypothetical protein